MFNYFQIHSLIVLGKKYYYIFQSNYLLLLNVIAKPLKLHEEFQIKLFLNYKGRSKMDQNYFLNLNYG